MVVVALIEERSGAILVHEDVWMATLGSVPRVPLATREQRLVADTLEVDAILADGHANLLRVVVVGTAIEHIELALMLNDRSTLYAFLLPRQGRNECGSIDSQLPLRTAEVGIARSHGHALYLLVHVLVAGGEIKEPLAFELLHFCVDGTATIPVTSRTEDRIRCITGEMQSIVAHGMADGVAAPVAVSLVEEVQLAVDHLSAWSTIALLLIVGIGVALHLADSPPVFLVLAFCDADSPSMRIVAVSRDGVVHEVAPLELDYVWVLCVGPSQARGVAVHHDSVG